MLHTDIILLLLCTAHNYTYIIQIVEFIYNNITLRERLFESCHKQSDVLIIIVPSSLVASVCVLQV